MAPSRDCVQGTFANRAGIPLLSQIGVKLGSEAVGGTKLHTWGCPTHNSCRTIDQQVEEKGRQGPSLGDARIGPRR